MFGEYEYGAIAEKRESGLADALRKSLESDGFSTSLGGEMDCMFEEAGFRVAGSGKVQ